MHLTIHNDKAIDSRIEQYLDKISIDISQLLPVRALILYGAFGRGEGRIVVKNGHVHIVNDLDIIAVIDSNRSGIRSILRGSWNYHKISSANWTQRIFNVTKPILWYILRNSKRFYTYFWTDIRKQLQKKAFPFIDIKPMPYHLLPRMPFTMDNFDLKYGGYVFWGDKTVLDVIPDYDATKMSEMQGRRLLLNRLITFLEARRNLNSELLEGREAAFCNYQSSKVVMACIDAYLVKEGKFTTKYQNKYKQFINMTPYKKFHTLGEHALSIKVGPDPIHTSNPVLFWEKTGEFFFQTVNDCLLKDKDVELAVLGKGMLKNIYEQGHQSYVVRGVKYFFRRNLTARQFLETINLLILFSLFSDVDNTEIIKRLVTEYGKRFHVSIPKHKLRNLQSIYPLMLQLYYEKMHIGIATYDLWKKISAN